MISKIKYEYLLGFIAIVWVLFFSFTIQLKPGFSYIGDDSSYLYSARLLYINFQLDNTRPLLISAIQGLPYLFDFSDNIVVKWGLFINFSCWFLTAFLLFQIVSNFSDRKKGFWFALLYVFCIGNLAHAFNFLSESCFIFLILLSVYFVSKYFETKTHYYLTIGISILFFNTLIKPVSIGLAFILIVFFIAKTRKILFNKFLFLLLVSLSMIVFQMYSEKRNYGDFTLSYIGSITYYNYLGDRADCYKKNVAFVPGNSERSKKFGLLSSHEMKKIAEKDLKNQLQYNCSNLIKAYFYCIYSNSHKGSFIVSQCKNGKKTDYFDLFHFLFKAISKTQNIIFTIISVILSFYCLITFRKTDTFYLIIATFILYIFFISAISCFQCDRFHIAFFPLFIILFSGILKNLQTKSWLGLLRK
jgi:Dolichyl-phosphate-mannose-protein mannosyltransferase